MKGTKLLLIAIPFILVVTVLFTNNYQLNDKLKEKANKEKQLQELVERNEKVISYLNEQEGEQEEITYETWSEFMHIAEHLYEDSDTRFKKEWGLFLANAAYQKDIDPYLVYELLRTETGGTFDPETVGPQTKYGRAYGLAQFMTNTAPWIADMANLPYKKQLLYDPLYSIELATVYLDFLYKQYEDWDYALTAYHRGMYGLENYIAEHGHARSWYAKEIQEGAKEQALVAYN